ncbi:MAG: hypothetical protein ABIH66_06030 [bacterium]
MKFKPSNQKLLAAHFLLAACCLLRAGPPASADEWSYKPFAPTPARGPGQAYEERRRAYLEYCAADTTPHPLSVVSAAIIGKETTLSDEVMRRELDFIDSREDCGDFRITRYLRLLYKNNKYNFLTQEQREAIKNTILNFKYWVDEPGPDRLISWTENHQILFHTAEYLAGQLFHDETFTNNGETGAWHRDHARPLILQWIDRRARWGFSEWDSNVYYNEDIPALANLAEFADDPEIANLASMALDLMLFDIGSDLFYGAYVTSHGRTYEGDILGARNDSIVATSKLVWGVGAFNSRCSFSAASIATSERYSPPEAILSIGTDIRDEYTNRERHGIAVQDAISRGINPEDPANLPFYWGMGAYSHPEVVETSLRMADEWNLWNHPFFNEAHVAKGFARAGNIKSIARSTAFEPDRALLGTANKLTFRTPDYMLSAAQDYRPGEMGNQHHILQATLSPDAVVFITNPGALADSGDRTPTYWGGSNRLPRVAQYRNVLICLFHIRMTKAVGERNVFAFTHAYFPREAFDEVVSESGWHFGRVGDGYIALYSSQPSRWAEGGEYAGREIIADGKKNAWIIQMGRSAVDGDFADFRKRIIDAELTIDGTDVSYKAPGTGLLEFAWDGPLRVDGEEIPLGNYPRVENPYCRSEFDSGVYVIENDGHRLTLDFNKRLRKIEKE